MPNFASYPLPSDFPLEAFFRALHLSATKILANYDFFHFDYDDLPSMFLHPPRESTFGDEEFVMMEIFFYLHALAKGHEVVSLGDIEHMFSLLVNPSFLGQSLSARAKARALRLGYT